MLPSRLSVTTLPSSNGSPSMRHSPTWRDALICLDRLPRSRAPSGAVCERSLVCLSRSASHGQNILQRLLRRWRSRTGSSCVDPDAELEFLHDLPVELMWGVGPKTQARLAEAGVHTIGQLARTSERRLERLLGHAAGGKLAALSWNRDPRQIRTNHRSRSAGAQSALGRKPADKSVYQPTLRHLSDRIGARLRAKSLCGQTITVRVRFADLRAVTRSLTLAIPTSSTRRLAEVAETLVRTALMDHPAEATISLLGISVSHLTKQAEYQLDLPLGGNDRRRETARGTADSALDTIRERFGWKAIGYGSVVLDSEPIGPG